MSTKNSVVPSSSYQQPGGLQATPFKTSSLPILQNILNNKTMTKFSQNLVQDLKLSNSLIPFNGGEELPAGGWRGGDELPAGGWRNLIKSDLYLTRDGKGRFEFDFYNNNAGVSITPIVIPTVKRDGLPSDSMQFERPADQVFSSLAEAKHWAGNWAEGVWKYLNRDFSSANGYPPCETIPNGGFNGGDELPAGGWRGGDELPAGGWRSYIKSDAYRTEDGRAVFEYEFHQAGNHIEIDIVNTPSYGSRDTNPHIIHQLNSDRGGKKICFGDPTIVTDMAEAKKWAKNYSEATWDYIKTGKPFPNE